jgi:DinB superfamily
MPETPQEYRQRIMSHVGSADPLKLQAAAPQKLERLLKGVPVSRLRRRPAPEKWSIAEIVAHLADVEIVVGYRLRVTLGAPGTPIQAFDQDGWATSGHYDKRDPRKSLEEYRAFREANLCLLKLLTAEQWNHYGLHAERGEESVGTMVRMIAGHDLNHIKQIEAILNGRR